MPMTIDVKDVNMVHKTLLCLKNAETEFGLFCAGAHAMLLSLLKDYINVQTVYTASREDFSIICALADNLYDWFESLKRREMMDEELLKRNRQLGEQVMSLVHRVREKERGKEREEKDGDE